MEKMNVKETLWATQKDSAGPAEESHCPLCKGPGQEVQDKTVRHFVLKSLEGKVLGTNYYICLSEDCPASYYNLEEEIVFKTKDMKIPIWFKKDANPKYICYCNQVREEEIIQALLNKGAKDMKDIVRLTGAMKNGKCQTNNPLGKCCGPVIQELIDKTLNEKQMKAKD